MTFTRTGSELDAMEVVLTFVPYASFFLANLSKAP